MALQVVNGAMLRCTFGVAPSSMLVTPEKKDLAGNQPAANISDHIPMKNILPFGMCNTVSNPTVASATAAALGVMTPQPCIPATVAPWMIGAITVPLVSQPALGDDGQCICAYGGVISVTLAGQVTVQLGSKPPAAGDVAAAAAANAEASNQAMQDEADQKKKAAEEALANAKTPEEQAAARAKQAEAEEAQRKATVAHAGNDLANAKKDLKEAREAEEAANKEQAAAQDALRNASTPEAQAAARKRVAEADQAASDAQAAVKESEAKVCDEEEKVRKRDAPPG